MPNTKCETCSTWHGGFHLCLGRKVDVVAEQYEALHGRINKLHVSGGKAAGAKERWARHWEENRERDQKILEMYNSGSSLQTVGDHFGLHKPTVKSIVIRLGGTMRPRNQGRPR